ncbi:hypothetical protein EZV62_006406 [Acer yangbiense]|uniref:Uncharacterized protein n=1 Tax=Acer yangbiense TaxID=1000413 RepID=A0A5C7I7D2_9ROSI|nr:hypothetical protein EZV62_006406 [Acer yangbiense]
MYGGIKKSPTKAVGQLEIDRRLRKVVKGINLEKKADKEGFVTAADKGKGFRMDSDDESSSSLMESESRAGHQYNLEVLVENYRCSTGSRVSLSPWTWRTFSTSEFRIQPGNAYALERSEYFMIDDTTK